MGRPGNCAMLHADAIARGLPMIFAVFRLAVLRFAAFLLVLAAGASAATAENIVARIASAPVFANGLLTDTRSGLTVFLQRTGAPGDNFLDPAVTGYGIAPGGRMEIELAAGFERDPNVPLDERAILLVAGTPQQAITPKNAGYAVTEGANPNTFVITPTRPEGMPAETLIAAAPAAATEPMPQRGIKIVHIGRHFAFINRGKTGTIAVRFVDAQGNITAQGSTSVDFLQKPSPQIFPTNIPAQKRNRNWQRIAPGGVVGVAQNTLPLSFLLFARNEGFGNDGIFGAGVLSAAQLQAMRAEVPPVLAGFRSGLIVQDANEDGLLDPATDRIIGGITETVPEGAAGHHVATPTFDGRLWLSQPTGRFDPRAADRPGGAIMDIVYRAGDKPGIYRVTLSLLRDPADPTAGIGSQYTYTVVAK